MGLLHYPVMNDVNITRELLLKLNTHKAPGLDGMTLRNLKELANPVANIANIVFSVEEII